MSIWTIEGGRPLRGSLGVQGSKNAVLPVLAASVLVRGVSIIENCPALSDVDASIAILRELGCSVVREGGTLTVDSRHLSGSGISREHMEAMRSSVLFMGALLARRGEVEAFLPGGCELGARPVDYHLAAFSSLGAEISQEDERISCRAPALQGAKIRFPGKSVGATENALLCACGARGETVLHNAAAEPEITALCDFLRSAGARIVGDGTDTIRVLGFESEGCVHFTVPGDRIAAASYLCFAAATKGHIRLSDCRYAEMLPLLQKLKALGADLRVGEEGVELDATAGLRGDITVCTEPYPGFPTDAAPLLLAACCTNRGQSFFKETIFSDRLRYVPSLMRMGADIELQRSSALVRGVERLRGAELEGTDLRGSAALLCAALSAEGKCVLRDPGHLERGYERLEENLLSLGAQIKKE